MLWKNTEGMKSLPISSKIGISAFLILSGIGYITGFLNILLTYGPTDEKPGLSVQDVRISFYGARDKTALEASIDGSMKQYFAADSEYQQVKDWLAAGAKEEEYVELDSIMAVSCNTCHSSAAKVADVVTETYEDIKPFLAQDTGKSASRLVSLTHTHLMSTLILIFGLVLIFGLTSYSELLKTVIISFSFASLAVDLGSWWLAKLSGAFAPLVILGGASLGVTFAALVLLPLYDLWLKKAK